MKSLVFAAFALALAQAGADGWPFITIRETLGPTLNPEKFEEVIAINAKYPGSCDEYWFCHCGGYDLADAKKDLEKWLRFVPLCEKAGIQVGFQQGVTLGHGDPHAGGEDSTSAKPYPYSDDAWAKTRDGSKTYTLCPRSPEVLEYQEKYTALVCETLNPSSIWLDDDLRMGCYKVDTCFCPRCIAAFNEMTGAEHTREEIVERLYGGAPSDPLRRQWVDFNASQLALFGAATRRGADAANAGCRLALQTVSANDFITGWDYRPVLEALSGGGRRQVGVRAGCGFYGEEHPREMLEKMLAVTRECEGCKTYGGLVAQVSYEEENYYREVLHKSVGAVMIESAVALASGCDALTLYWWDYSRDEPLSYYEEFASELSRWRPYLERVAKVNKFTHLGGIANDLPDDLAERGGNFTRYSPVDFNLSTVGIPVTVEEAKPVWMYRAEEVPLKFAFPSYPTTAELESFRDFIDRESGGKVPVRIGKTHMMRLFPRTDDEDRLHAVTCWNLSMGPARKITVRLRNPASAKWVWARPCEDDVALEAVPGELAGELVVELPELPGYAVGTLFAE